MEYKEILNNLNEKRMSLKSNDKNENDILNKYDLLCEELVVLIKNIEEDLFNSNNESTRKIAQLERELNSTRYTKSILRKKYKSLNKKFMDYINKKEGLIEQTYINQIKHQDKTLSLFSRKLHKLHNTKLGIVWNFKLKSLWILKN